MVYTNTKFAFLFIAYASLLRPCLTQSSDNSSSNDCGTEINSFREGRRPINSTNTVAINHSNFWETWYLSLMITDRREPGYSWGPGKTFQERSGFLSVPESFPQNGGANTSYCLYRLPGQNAVADGKTGSCKGVISEECRIVLQYSTPDFSDDKCHVPDNYREACSVDGYLGTSEPADFSRTECTLDSLPHVDLPDNYTSFGNLPVGAIGEGGDDYDNFDLYDLHVRQSVPIVLTIRHWDGFFDTRVICLAPNKTVEGSREPESDFPPSAASSLVSNKGVGSLAIAITLLVGVTLG